MPASNIVETQNLTKIFKIRPLATGSPTAWIQGLKNFIRLKTSKKSLIAVDHVNLGIQRGEFFGLLGPNGAGKTTLVKILCTVLKPDEGTALVNGFDILKNREEVLRSVSLVTGISWLGSDYALSVRENLEFYAVVHGFDPVEIKDRISESLAVVGLEDKANARPHILSGGQRQRMMIARGLLIRTPLFFLDEPTAGLDPEAARNVRDFIKKELNLKMSQTIVMTTHYMFEAETLCDRVAIMDQGKIIACDTPNNLKKIIGKKDIIEIKATSITSSVVDKLRETNHIERVALSVVDPIMAEGILRIHTPDSRTSLPKIVKILEENNIDVKRASITQPTLEDVFMHFTGRGLA